MVNTIDSYRRVRGGTHGQILLQAYTVNISDSEPEKSGSLPESSRYKKNIYHFFHYMILLLSIKAKRTLYINVISLGALI